MQCSSGSWLVMKMIFQLKTNYMYLHSASQTLKEGTHGCELIFDVAAVNIWCSCMMMLVKVLLFAV